MMQESVTSGNEKMERNAYRRHAVREKIRKGVLRICNPEEITWTARKAQGEQIPGIMMVAAKIVSCFFLRQLCLNEKRQYLHLFQIQIFPIFPDYKSGILPHLLTICINEVKRIILSLACKGGHGRLNGTFVPTPPGRLRYPWSPHHREGPAFCIPGIFLCGQAPEVHIRFHTGGGNPIPPASGRKLFGGNRGVRRLLPFRVRCASWICYPVRSEDVLPELEPSDPRKRRSGARVPCGSFLRLPHAV